MGLPGRLAGDRLRADARGDRLLLLEPSAKVGLLLA